MGNRFVVSDPGACIGCQTCMASCLTKHDVVGDIAQPRLNLVTTLAVSSPIACHHCQDAPCVNACPTGTLYIENDRVAIAEERCIGCSNCVMACPFGAVTLTQISKPVTLGSLVLKGESKPYVIKCDLCADRANGPACVESCPTKALVVMDAKELYASVKQKKLEAAASMESMSSLPLASV